MSQKILEQQFFSCELSLKEIYMSTRKILKIITKLIKLGIVTPIIIVFAETHMKY